LTSFAMVVQVASKADLLVLTEKLCKAEETFVRVAACESAQTVGEAMTEEEIASSFTPMLRRLIAESWWTAKVSAAALMATAYPKCTAEVKAELRASLMQITKDEAPMVRRAVARALGKLCAVFDAADVVPNLLPSLNKLANDDQDSVRILAFGSCLEMCSTQPADQCTDFIYPAIETFAKDASWRVRLEVARALTQVVESVVHAGPMPVSIVALMLKDPELDVRRFALEHSNSVVQKFPELAESSGIVRAICLLADVDPEVPNALPMKVLLAAQGVKMATLLGQEVARTYIIPMMVKLTQEESVEVRIAVLENWAELVTVAGGPAVLEAFPLSALCSDSSWRVRKSFLEGLPTLAATVPRSGATPPTHTHTFARTRVLARMRTHT
jgi:serine/threonine-protein phosphatase 2A regulatory subunit A